MTSLIKLKANASYAILLQILFKEVLGSVLIRKCSHMFTFTYHSLNKQKFLGRDSTISVENTIQRTKMKVQ